MEPFINLLKEFLENQLNQVNQTQKQYTDMSEFLMDVKKLSTQNSQALEKAIIAFVNATKGINKKSIGITSKATLTADDLAKVKTLMQTFVSDISKGFKDTLNLGVRTAQGTITDGDRTKIKNVATSTGFKTSSSFKNTVSKIASQLDILEQKINKYQKTLSDEEQHFKNLGFWTDKLAWQFNYITIMLNKSKFVKALEKDIKALEKDYGRDVAEAMVKASYYNKNMPIGPMLKNPDMEAGAGGSATLATQRAKFIKSLVLAFNQSPMGQRLSNLISDGATMMSLSLASQFPALQGVIMGALALGIPQSLGPILGGLAGAVLQLAVTEGGRALLAAAIPMVAPVLLGLITGGLGTFLIHKGLEASINRTNMSESSKYGAKAGSSALIGSAITMGLWALAGTMATVLAGTVAAPFVVVGLQVAAVTAGIVSVGMLLKNLWGWFKTKDDSPGWLEKFWGWLKQFKIFQMLAGDDWGSGGDSNSPKDPNSTASVVPITTKLSNKSASDEVGKSVMGHKITSGYGWRVHPKGTGSSVDGQRHFHRGIDLDYAEGENVKVDIGGKVERVLTEGQSGGYGNTVYIRDKFGALHQYSHLQGFGDKIKVGASVGARGIIGKAGHTGFATGPHVHYEVSEWNEKSKRRESKDPLLYQDEYKKRDQVSTVNEAVKKAMPSVVSMPASSALGVNDLSGNKSLIYSSKLNETLKAR